MRLWVRCGAVVGVIWNCEWDLNLIETSIDSEYSEQSNSIDQRRKIEIIGGKSTIAKVQTFKLQTTERINRKIFSFNFPSSSPLPSKIDIKTFPPTSFHSNLFKIPSSNLTSNTTCLKFPTKPSLVFKHVFKFKAERSHEFMKNEMRKR
jgi:hypothetical protein